MGYKQLEGLMRTESQRAEKELARTGEGLHALERRIFARHAIFCVIFVLLYLFSIKPKSSCCPSLDTARGIRPRGWFYAVAALWLNGLLRTMHIRHQHDSTHWHLNVVIV